MEKGGKVLKGYKFKIGVKLLKWGSLLVFKDKQSKDLLKDAVNRNTLIGSIVESGNHIAGEVQPLCEYDTQSIVNVLKQELLVKKDLAFVGMSPTDKMSCYKEKWKY